MEGPVDLLAEARERGFVTVGIADEVPYGYIDSNGDVTGEAPVVAARVLEELGIGEIRAEVVSFGALIGSLQAGKFDMIAAGMFITPERAAQISFSDPDYCIGQAFGVREGNPHGLEDFRSVVEDPDVTIAVLAGGVEEGYALRAGVLPEQIEVFTDLDAQYEALVDGRVDAITGTSPSVRRKVEELDGFVATESFLPVDENGDRVLACGAFGFRREDEAFRDAFNEALDRLQAAGHIEPLITQFGFAPEDVRRAEGLTVEDVLANVPA